MIVKAKGGSKKIHLSEEEITLEQLKECGYVLFTPNINYEERVIEVSFPFDRNVKSHSTALHEEAKLYSIIKEEVTIQLIRISQRKILNDSSEKKISKEDLKLDKVKFSEVYISGLGNLVIKR